LTLPATRTRWRGATPAIGVVAPGALGQGLVGRQHRDRSPRSVASSHPVDAGAPLGADEDNLVISLLAKQEFAVPRVVARVNHPKNQWLFNESWGVDVSVSTPQLLTALVEEAVSVGALVRLLQFQGGLAHLVEITLAEDSPADDTAIADLDFPRDAVVVAVVRADRLIVPRGDTTLQSGDEVLVLVAAEAEDAVHALFIADQQA
jgi:trk system potassium uptake protein TrkA